jgi:hypothetical protein
MAGIPPILPKKMATPAIQIQSSCLMLLDGRCRVIGVASTLILLIKANGNICETLRKVPEVHPEDALEKGVFIEARGGLMITNNHIRICRSKYCIMHM